MPIWVVVDANVVLSALRSRDGASFAVLQHALQGRLKFCVSVPLVLEYEEVLKRHALSLQLSSEEVDNFI